MIGSTIGPYRVLRELGRGHFGTVWLAEGGVPLSKGGRSEPRLVAIKQLREWSMSGFETLVRDELLAHVRHRTLCTVYEFLDRESAVVMEYVHGVTLRQVVDALGEGRPMWSDAVLLVGIELAECLCTWPPSRPPVAPSITEPTCSRWTCCCTSCCRGRPPTRYPPKTACRGSVRCWSVSSGPT